MDEITRASDADRRMYADHLSTLYSQGYISDGELPGLQDKVLAARTLAGLDELLTGMPLLPGKKDRSQPRYFMPRLLASGIVSLAAAVIPANLHVSHIMLVLSLFLGITGAAASLVTLIWMGLGYDEQQTAKREEAKAENIRLRQENVMLHHANRGLIRDLGLLRNEEARHGRI